MPVNTNVQNASAILDAIADFYDKTPTAQQKLNIVEEFINEIGGANSDEDKAAAMIAQIGSIIRNTGRAHARIAQEAANAASEEAAADAANSNAI